MNIGKWIRWNASTLLTCLGAGGVVATVVLAIKATPKAHNKIVDAKIDKTDRMMEEDQDLPKLTVLETVQLCWKDYLPTAAVGTASLVCIFGANVLSRRQQASMAAAYTALASMFEGYRDKVDAICGPATDEMIRKSLEQEKKDKEDGEPPWDQIQTFQIDGYMKNGNPAFFESTMQRVMCAEYNLNRMFILRGYVTLNEFLDLIGLEKTAPDDLGWDASSGFDFYGYEWIDFCHNHYSIDGMDVCAIEMPFQPHLIFEAMEDDSRPSAKNT